MAAQQITNSTSATLIAALMPSAVFAVFAGSLEVLPLALGVALVHALVLGLPIYLLFKSKGWANLVSAAVMGFFVGSVPFGVVSWPMQFSDGRSSSWVGPDQIPTMVDGVPTLAGWIVYLESIGQLGGLGALGGLAFWLVVRLLRPSPGARDENESPAERPAERPAGKLRTPSALSLSILSTALALTIGIFSIPTLTKDRSCHNVLRDGRDGIGPTVVIDLQISDDDWPALVADLRGFATRHALSFRDTSEVRPGVLRTLYVSLCDEAGVTIAIVEQRWSSRGVPTISTGPGVKIAVYLLSETADWRGLSRALIAELDQRWPDKVRFRDSGGRTIPVPDEFRSD